MFLYILTYLSTQRELSYFAVRNQLSMEVSYFYTSFQHRFWWPLFRTNFSQTKDVWIGSRLLRYNASLPPKQRAGLIAAWEDRGSGPLRSKEYGWLLPIIRELGSLSSGFLSHNGNHCILTIHLLFFFVTVWRLGIRELIQMLILWVLLCCE